MNIPEGWKLVPVKLTDAMWAAMTVAMRKTGTVADVHAAMLAASPLPSSEPNTGGWNEAIEAAARASSRLYNERGAYIAGVIRALKREVKPNSGCKLGASCRCVSEPALCPNWETSP